MTSTKLKSSQVPSEFHPEDSVPPLRRHMTWLPDWKDGSAYPDEAATNAHLAWELLRRNRYFQQECMNAVDSPTVQAALLQTWGLRRFKPFWKAHNATEQLFEEEMTQSSSKNSSLFVTASHLAGPNRLVLELNIGMLGQSATHDDESFLSLRDVVQQYVPKKSEQRRLPRRGVWTGKIGRHLRVIDALSQASPVSRQEIGQQFHKEGLILTEHPLAWSEKDIVAKASAQYHDSDPKQVKALIEAEKEIQAERWRQLAKRYSKEVGSQIERAYSLVYENGYRLLTVSGIRPSTRKKTYSPSKKRARGEGIFEQAGDYIPGAW